MHARTDRFGHSPAAHCLAAKWTLAILCAVSAPASVTGQTITTIVNGQPVTMSREEFQQQSAARRGRGAPPPAASTPGGNPGEQPKPGGDQKAEQKPGGSPAGENKDDKKPPVTRPNAPPKEPDPAELDIALDEHGLVPAFNFSGQPWPAVFAWYAKLANSSSDYQELPGDYINLFTEQPQTLDDVRNLLNRLLLARGFTILQRDRIVSVYKVENVEPGLVEQIDEIELFNRPPYDFKKAVFKLPKSMEVDKAKDDLKQVLSPKARVLPFVSTRQVLVLDAVVNLRTVSEMLNMERAKEDGKTPLRQFRLTYRRAEDVIDILYITLGMDPKSKPSQQELQVRQQELQILQQMAQRGTNVAKMLKPDGPPVFLTFNSQMNSIIANAPEEQMKMIEDTIRWLDVPLGGDPAQGAPGGIAGLVGGRVLQTHKLRTLNPVAFKTTVDDIGDLSPFTVVQADQAGRSLIVQGIEVDQQRIAKLIEELDGEERTFKVIQLRMYPATGAAESIRELVFGKAEEKSSDSSNDAYYKYLMSLNNRNQQQEKDPHEGFYVAADELNNRLLIKANRLEFEQIYSLLRELGEVPDETRDGMAMRVLEPTGNEVLEEIRKIWAQTGGNPLIINGANDDSTGATTTGDDAKDDESAKPATDVGVSNDRPVATPSIFARYAAAEATAETDEEATAAGQNPSATTTSQTPATDAAPAPASIATDAGEPSSGDKSSPPAEAAPGKAPVSISVTPDGRILIQSADASAVAQLESLIATMSPPAQRIKRFPLKHTSASYMLWNLQDVFEEELKDDGEMIRDYYGRWQQTGAPAGSGLAKRRKLMITYDGPSNSILVANATNTQLYEIDQLIKELDQPSPEAMVRARVTATVKVQYSRASVIAAALKEVYIDLLSTRDREFASGEEGGGRSTSSGSRAMTEIKFSDLTTNGVSAPPRIPVAFNGEMSIGFDDVSNNILISCREELYEGVVAMIHKLDEQSAPTMSVVVHSVSGSVGAENLQKTISESMGRAWLGGRPEEQAVRGGAQRGQNQRAGNGQPQPRGNRGRRSGNNNR